MGSQLKGTVYVMICVLLWALIPVVAKIGQSSLDSHQFLFWSSLISLITLGSIAAWTGQLQQISHFGFAEICYLLFLGLLGTYIYYLFLYMGYARAEGMEVLVVQYTWPILIVVLSVFILKESLNGQKVLAILLGFIGVITVLTRADFAQLHLSNPLVIALVATGAFCFALFSVLTKKVKRDPLAVTTLYFLSATIASFISMMIFSDLALPKRTELGSVLVNGILVNGVSYLFWLLALNKLAASFIAPFIYLTPIISAVYLLVFFDQELVTADLIGLVLVVSGGLINAFKIPEKAK